ncbi:MAG: hypothetical protein AAGA65_23890 [Actinomycetota bacterium]
MSSLGNDIVQLEDQRDRRDPPGHILSVLMGALRISDADLVAHIEQETRKDELNGALDEKTGKKYRRSRQVMHRKRMVKTRLGAEDIYIFATALGVPEELFFRNAAHAIRWVAKNQPERLAYVPEGGDDGEPAKLHPLAGVVQW